MKSLLEHSAECIASELRNKVYVEQRFKERKVKNPKIDISFIIKELPSKHTPDVDQLHLVCFDPNNSSTILYLAEIKPTTAKWVCEESSFYEKTLKFGEHCISILEGRGGTNPQMTGQILAQIAIQEFNKLYTQNSD